MTTAISDNSCSQVEEDVTADSRGIVVLGVSSLLIGHVVIVYRTDALILPNFTLIKALASFVMNGTVSLGVNRDFEFYQSFCYKTHFLHRRNPTTVIHRCAQRWDSKNEGSAVAAKTSTALYMY